MLAGAMNFNESRPPFVVTPQTINHSKEDIKHCALCQTLLLLRSGEERAGCRGLGGLHLRLLNDTCPCDLIMPCPAVPVSQKNDRIRYKQQPMHKVDCFKDGET